MKIKTNGLQGFCWGMIMLLALLQAAAQAMTGTERVITDHSVYLTNEPIKVAFTNGPANSKDWVAIYHEGEIPGSGPLSIQYLYVNGSTTAGTALANGEVTFSSGLATPGNYVAYFLENDGYRLLASNAFTVVTADVPLVRADKSTYAKGDKITVSFSRGPGNVKDWIGIYAAGVTPGPGSTAYKYVDNTTTGSTAFTDGTVTFDTGLAIPGRWVAYLLEDDTYNVLAQDAFDVVLTGSIVALKPDHQNYLPGQPININFDGGPGNAKDWIGVYKPGQRPGPVQSTDWNYVGGSQTASVGLASGAITLTHAFSGPQEWRGYFMVDDGYNIIGNTAFNVVADGSPIAQLSKRIYNLSEAITVAFTNAPGNAKDWIGIYPKGVNPADATATLWNYTDGTRAGTAGITEGELTFSAGLNSEDEWTAYLFENDTYNVLGKEDFSVRKLSSLPMRLVSISPDDQSLSNPTADLRVVFENRDTSIDTNSIAVQFDGLSVPFTLTTNGSIVTVSRQATQVYPTNSLHTYTISFKDSVGTASTLTTHFRIGDYKSIALPAPIFFESFDTTPEGTLPTGWTASNSSEAVDVPADLGNLGSSAYNDFTVVDASRLGGDFLTYATAAHEVAPIAQILGPGFETTVVNGSLVRNYANGHVLIGISGYHLLTGNQILDVTTPNISTTGKTNIYLSFHSLLEQNQDAIEGIEVSTDSGVTWSPVVYYLDPPDIISVDNVIDPDQTFNTFRSDIAKFQDGSGGTYGSFLKAPIDTNAAAHIRPRADNDSVGGTRVELIRVPEADNKASVQFRIFYAGTDSWYLGLDDFGVYSFPATPTDDHVSITQVGANINITAPVGTRLETTTTLGIGAVWSPLTVDVNGRYSTTADGTTRFFRSVR